MRAIQSSQNALLESPTGTGKTLCLLTGAIAALKELREKQSSKCQIIYCSRTFTQLNQVLRELRKTCYVPSCLTLASKDKLCSNPTLNPVDQDKMLAGSALRLECKSLRKNKACKHYLNVDKDGVQYPEEGLDIEELWRLSQKLEICSYYHNKEQQAAVDLVMMPYNYILSSQLRKNMQINLQDAIVIIDEAHNISQAAEQALSFEISTENLKRITYELTYLVKQRDPSVLDKVKHQTQTVLDSSMAIPVQEKFNNKLLAEEVAAVLIMVSNFHKFIDGVCFSQSQSSGGLRFNTKHMQELLDRCWIFSGHKVKDFFGQF